MYIVKNIGRNELVLGDLRLSLRSGQQIDLDKISSRYVLEQSRGLKTALKKNMIKIVRKEPIGGPPQTNNVTTIIEKNNNEEVMKELKNMRKELIDRQQAMARKQEAALRGVQGGLDSDSMGQLQKAIEALQGISGGSVGTAVESDEFSMPDDKAVDIHKRTVDRISKDTKGKIRHDESRSKTNVDSHISELEDLLE